MVRSAGVAHGREPEDDCGRPGLPLLRPEAEV